MDNAFDDSKLMNFVNAFGSGLSSWRWRGGVGGLCYDRTEDCVCLRGRGWKERERERMNKRTQCSFISAFL